MEALTTPLMDTFGININDNLSFTVDNVTSALDDVSNVTVGPLSNGTVVLDRSWIYWVPGPVICGFGMACNILNLCVLSSPILKESPYVYLTALAISDFTLLAFSFCHLVMSNMPQTYFKSIYDIYFFFATSNIFFNSSVWLIVLMTIERMLFVIWPLKMRSSRSNARKGIVSVFIACTCINVPRFWCYEVRLYGDLYYPFRSDFMQSQTYYIISLFHAVMINFVPLTILAITNTTLLCAVYKARKSRRQMNAYQHDSSARKEQIRLTRTLIAVVVLFFFTTTPSAFVDDPISFALFGKGRSWREFLRSQDNQTFIYISNILLFLNSSLNFILYCAFNRKFRQAMKSRFLCLVTRTGKGTVILNSKSVSTKNTSV